MKKSILRNKNKLQKAVLESNSIKECLEKLGLRAAGGNYKQLIKWCNIHNIKVPRSSIKYTMRGIKGKIPLKEILIKNSTYSRYHLKKRLISEGILKNSCNICSLSCYWNNIPISLQLDHINGIYNDNRIENLRLLCPNCHSQTETFAGKNLKINQ